VSGCFRDSGDVLRLLPFDPDCNANYFGLTVPLPGDLFRAAVSLASFNAPKSLLKWQHCPVTAGAPPEKMLARPLETFTTKL